jgi:hypothetical protein
MIIYTKRAIGLAAKLRPLAFPLATLTGVTGAIHGFPAMEKHTEARNDFLTR